MHKTPTIKSSYFELLNIFGVFWNFSITKMLLFLPLEFQKYEVPHAFWTTLA